ncbi:MAG TPA: DUF937 domain-containing protein [Planctomycetota bacterium]|nr:DUF937 domain-containing protein [Planctomycetota bacterium]
MALNLLELVKSYFSGPVVDQISGALGESRLATQSAIAAAAPAVLGGVIQQASTPSGASTLSAALDKLDLGFLGNIGSAVTGGGQGFLDMGLGFVRNLFGGRLGAVSDGIAKASGMSLGSISKLLAMVAPVVMGVLAKQKRASAMGSGELAELLNDQKRAVAGALPSGLGDAIGFGAVGDAAAATASAAGGAAAYVGRETVAAGRQAGSWLRTFLPILLIGVAAVVAWRLIGSSSRSDVVRASGDGDGASLESARRSLGGAFDDATAALVSVRDEASARAALPKLEVAERSVSSLAITVRSMPPSTRSGLNDLIGAKLPSLRSLADKALSIPGARDVIGPTVDRLFESLSRLAG